jgi:hypothetical protein
MRSDSRDRVGAPALRGLGEVRREAAGVALRSRLRAGQRP